MLNDISDMLHKLFATNQNYYAKQMPDGNYKKSPGLVTPDRIKDCLAQAESIAVYQKNKDSTIKWVCFDFDVLKKHIGESSYQEARENLNQSVKDFCEKLENIGIPYLLEFSGNRGFHVWITLAEPVSHHIGYQIQQKILYSLNPNYNPDQIGIDLFPSSASPTDGVGKCVKLPLSKHKKSGKYSLIITSLGDIDTVKVSNTLTDEMKQDALSALTFHKSIAKSEIEDVLDVFFDLTHEEDYYSDRVRLVQVKRKFNIDELKAHWENFEPLKNIGDSIFHEQKLNHSQRKLLVGMFCNVRCETPDFGYDILQEIFSYTSNYDSVKSGKAISALSSFYFPSQQQIEEQGDAKFSNSLDTEELIKCCVPNYISHELATFDISDKDIEITRRAELNYLFQNDEVQARLVADLLATGSNQDFLEKGNSILANPSTVQFYKHLRYESEKSRTLISLKASERVITSCILKQLLYFYGFEQNSNSHGYQANKGFASGYVFKPWLFLWIQFISNISSALEDESNKNYYVVKTDIKSYYESIPHDNLKRLMLGGVNSRIDAALETLNESSRLKYTKLIDSLFSITNTIVDGNKGMPQGPAYARYMAEIYLDNLDSKFEEKIQSSEVFLYQRYVDDIFFIAETKEIADATLAELEEELLLLGLKLNVRKTKVVQVKYFSQDFDQYRSQSKYAVDSVSKDFSSATNAQKDLAINEFINLIESDRNAEDLSFIFSHLSSVPALDKLKLEKVLPVLQSGVGRGSLYKHLFTFILENPENRDLLFEIDQYNELQSEVFTATVINILESARSDKDEICSLVINLQSKLTRTQLTDQHLVYISLRYGVLLELKMVSDDVLLECLRYIPEIENAYMPVGLVARLNTTLNDIKSLSDFVTSLYPLCACLSTSQEDLSSLAQTFYSKLTADYNQADLFSDVSIKTNETAAKYYYLLCLFSLSSVNSSSNLLRDMWQFCAITFDRLDYDYEQQRIANWFERLDEIDIDEGKALLVISSIVDGNIYRGFVDKAKSFKNFHNIVLLFLAYNQKYNHRENIAEALEDLRGINTFYDWIVDNDDVYLFPSNKGWFEENVIQNNCIILKKNDKILLRRPRSDIFSNIDNSRHGKTDEYAEVVVDYNVMDMVSVKDVTNHGNVVESIGLLLNLLSSSAGSDTFPNIFSQDKMLAKSTSLPFCDELMGTRNLIFEDYKNNVFTRKNNLVEFVNLFFLMAMDGSVESEVDIIEKYIRNLNPNIDFLVFIKHAHSQLSSFSSALDAVLYDLGFATALFLAIGQVDPIARLNQFVTQYHSFNSKDSDRHVYAIPDDLAVNDVNPLSLLDTIIASVSCVNKIFPQLPLFLVDDITHYRESMIECARHYDTELPIDITSFSKATHRISQVAEKITLNGKEFKFQDVLLVNLTTGNLQSFEPRYSVFMNSAEHVYYSLQDDTAYVIAINTHISKIYRAIEFRCQSQVPRLIGYPPAVNKEGLIRSLPQFEDAVTVVSVHRDISKEHASSMIVRWLCGLPEKFHHPLVALMSAHTLMHNSDRAEFIDSVKKCLSDSDLNVFLIKSLKDHNGTHRILYTDPQIGRKISNCSPLDIAENAKQATIVVDALITGTQVVNALKFYVKKRGSDQNYFSLSNQDRNKVSHRLRSLKKINVCVVLYTVDAVDRIRRWCKENIDGDFEVELLCGRNVGSDAFFGSSTKLGEQDKQRVYDLVNDDVSMRELHSYFKSNSVDKSRYLQCNVDKTNMIARYKSLPKKCFTFLFLDLRNGASAPFQRIPENYESFSG